MIKAESSTVIDRPTEEVFKYIATGFFENYPNWESAIVELEKTSQDPIGIGTTGRQLMNEGGWKAESTFQITDYEPEQKFSITGMSKPYFKNSYTFEPLDGSTKVTYIFEFSMDGVGRLFEPLIAGSAKKGSKEVVNNLKKLIEIN
ncbi:MAG: polyketide cyclase [Leptolyngbyaceae cyanobacterium RM2_2_4]|nr:polyketide cyclase [Leptolyngbyaceae cyanobacterium SM1_4_3]NJO49473.1 polyketide cyclase [Leptolyngbyaceae cyanobacterium RM2_2_4]